MKHENDIIIRFAFSEALLLAQRFMIDRKGRCFSSNSECKDHLDCYCSETISAIDFDSFWTEAIFLYVPDPAFDAPSLV